jgi:hypothetical protein
MASWNQGASRATRLSWLRHNILLGHETSSPIWLRIGCTFVAYPAVSCQERGIGCGVVLCIVHALERELRLAWVTR